MVVDKKKKITVHFTKIKSHYKTLIFHKVTYIKNNNF